MTYMEKNLKVDIGICITDLFCVPLELRQHYKSTIFQLKFLKTFLVF